MKQLPHVLKSSSIDRTGNEQYDDQFDGRKDGHCLVSVQQRSVAAPKRDQTTMKI